MVFSKVINTAGKIVLTVILLSLLSNFIYELGRDRTAHNVCVKQGFQSGFASANGVVCVYHVNYVPSSPK